MTKVPSAAMKAAKRAAVKAAKRTTIKEARVLCEARSPRLGAHDTM
jgi:hypothetical protein